MYTLCISMHDNRCRKKLKTRGKETASVRNGKRDRDLQVVYFSLGTICTTRRTIVITGRSPSRFSLTSWKTTKRIWSLSLQVTRTRWIRSSPTRPSSRFFYWVGFCWFVILCIYVTMLSFTQIKNICGKAQKGA